MTETKTKEQTPPNASAALSTPSELPIEAIVATFFLKSQDEHGRRTYSTARGKQGLFHSTCQFVKSMRGISAREHLPDDLAETIKREIGVALQGQVNMLVNDFDRHVIKAGGLRAILKKKGPVKSEAFATLRASRDTRGVDEHRLACLITLNQKQKRLDSLLEKDALEDEDREEITKLQRQIDVLRKERESKVLKKEENELLK